ncbi:drug resistance transporter, EmrB/QacA subfamily [Arthrobacter cupressi]|uniref:Drug resistance transporter, EmrB/QacA subfamily n=2 Tax=Arthrobacter cupressi TaxID=1045773 RepID=A0A1G8I7X7_9MICC|nr:EmrB/QacA subfamily drug resistance transporter [Arthrobacter cupressi]SDI15023.1 drug resistance transporter, EmrB/QacA subfamily [Arthrobacter cupressi]
MAKQTLERPTPARTAGGTAPANAAPSHTAPMTHRQIMEALTGLLAAFFTAILSSTIVANALPTIMSELHGTQTDFAWVITAALLANAATTPIWGKLADLFDKKLLVQLSIIIFVAGSVLAGFSDTIGLLLAARVVQGVALGGLTALAQAIIGTMIPPRDRGKYSGYMGAVMAVGTAGGPLLGGFIVDSPLGWRWTFFVCVPLAVVALTLLQATLKIEHIKRPAKIDWLGSILLTAGVSLLLIWVSFAGNPDYYDWISWQSAAMVGGGVLLLALLVVVESKVEQPIIPLKIIRERTTALAILASVAVGVAMFSSSTFLGQYFQVARGATPTEAGLLTLPMIAGNLAGSVVSGQLISRFGKWKGFLLGGSVLLIGGLALAGTIDHTTEFWVMSIYTAVFGLGLGLMMQNLVLAVQNTVRARDIGSASASVAFFRSVGGAIGVSVLGAVMSNHVKDLAAEGLAAAHIPVSGGSDGASMDLVDLPGPIREIMRAAYGDATALIFLIAAGISVLAFLAVLFIKEVPLRRTVDAAPEKELLANASAEARTPRETAELGTPETEISDLETAGVPGDGRAGTPDGGRPVRGTVQSEDLDLEFARILTAERPEHGFREEGELQVQEQLARTQQLLAEQLADFSQAQRELQKGLAEQRATAAEQARTAADLAALRKELKRERRRLEGAALLLVSGDGAAPARSARDRSVKEHGRHAG